MFAYTDTPFLGDSSGVRGQIIYGFSIIRETRAVLGRTREVHVTTTGQPTIDATENALQSCFRRSTCLNKHSHAYILYSVLVVYSVVYYVPRYTFPQAATRRQAPRPTSSKCPTCPPFERPTPNSKLQLQLHRS